MTTTQLVCALSVAGLWLFDGVVTRADTNAHMPGVYVPAVEPISGDSLYQLPVEAHGGEWCKPQALFSSWEAPDRDHVL